MTATLGSLLFACLPSFPEGDLGGSSTDGDETERDPESDGADGDETQGDACIAGEPSCLDGTLQVCNDGIPEATACDEVCAREGQVSNGCSGNECSCEVLPQAGVWEGTTGAGLPVLFALSEDGVLLGFIAIIEVDGGGCSGETVLTARNTPAIEDGAFVVAANLVLGDTPTTITGDFPRSDAAEGYIDGYSGSYVLLCGDSLLLGSGHVFDGTSWSASPCSDCSMECPFEDDDYCDEPEGTGLCFDGTDPADC